MSEGTTSDSLDQIRSRSRRMPSTVSTQRGRSKPSTCDCFRWSLARHSMTPPPRSKPGAWPPGSKSSASRSRSARCRKAHDTKHELVALPGACGTVRRVQFLTSR
jgi:hypothetical protein